MSTSKTPWTNAAEKRWNKHIEDGSWQANLVPAFDFARRLEELVHQQAEALADYTFPKPRRSKVNDAALAYEELKKEMEQS